MPRCSCAGNSCSCSVQVGDGLSIDGTGSASNPFIISLANRYVQIAHSANGLLDLSGVPGGSVVEVLLSANVTGITLPNNSGMAMDLIFKQTVAGRTVTFPSNIEWPGGTAPTVSATLDYWDWFRLRQLSGSTWLGVTEGLAIR